MLDAGTPAIMYRWYCTNCDLIDNITYSNKAMIRLIDTHCRMENGIQTTSLQTALTNAMTYKDNRSCRQCRHRLQSKVGQTTSIPSILAISTEEITCIDIPWKIDIKDSADIQVTMQLGGMVYYGNNHFTCRHLDNNGNILYNDGIETGSHSRFEGNINSWTDNNTWYMNGQTASALIYYRSRN